MRYTLEATFVWIVGISLEAVAVDNTRPWLKQSHQLVGYHKILLNLEHRIQCETLTTGR